MVKYTRTYTAKKKTSRAKQQSSLFYRAISLLFRSVVMAVTIGLGVLLLIAGYSDYINPTFVVLPAFFGLAFGVLLVAALCWLICLILMRRWASLLIFDLFCVAVFYPATRICPLHFSGHTAADEVVSEVDTFRVLTYNTCTMGRVRLSKIKEKVPIVDMVRTSGADVVFLQEYAFTLSSGGHTEKEIKKQLASVYPYYHFLPNERSKWRGIALFSRYPIVKAERVDKHKRYFSAMYYQIDYHGRLIGLLNMHLYSNHISTRDRQLYEEMIDHFEADSLSRIQRGMMRSLAHAWKVRSGQVSQLVRYLLDNHPADMPLLVGGDMNDTPISYCYRSLRQLELGDTWQDVGFGPGITYREHRFWFRIDHLFYNQYFQPIDAQVEHAYTYSDHYPVFATYQLLPQ